MSEFINVGFQFVPDCKLKVTYPDCRCDAEALAKDPEEQCRTIVVDVVGFITRQQVRQSGDEFVPLVRDMYFVPAVVEDTELRSVVGFDERHDDWWAAEAGQITRVGQTLTTSESGLMHLQAHLNWQRFQGELARMRQERS